MKKLLLIIAITLCIFQMVVLATAIDIGSAAIDTRSTYTNPNTLTLIDYNNPANATGKITSVSTATWNTTDLSGVIVATFYEESPGYFTARDSYNAGTVADGITTFDVDLDVEEGDSIGIWWTGGYLERDSAGFDKVYYQTGNLTECVNTSFYSYGGDAISLYGTGATVEVGIKWNGVTITKWNGITVTKINGK